MVIDCFEDEFENPLSLPQPPQRRFPRLDKGPSTLKPALIVDCDGTLCIKHPDRHILDYTRVGEDAPQEAVVHVTRRLFPSSTILILTGRTENCRDQTELWLGTHKIFHSGLFMRPDGDFRPDPEVKREIYERDIQPYYWVMGIFEDRLSVCRMWESLGLFVFNVNNGRGEF